MDGRYATDVIVVGAGPVGLVLAMCLAQQGTRVTIVETRHQGEPPNVKCNHVAARSMEVFRKLGVVQTVRDAGLPPDYPHDVVYRTAMTGQELTRIPIPSREERFTAQEGPDTGWPTPEPPHRINQIFLEPILFEHAARQPGIRIFNRTEFISFSETADGVTVKARNLDSDTLLEIEGTYLVGCDGARSAVRKQMGATLAGDAVVQRVQSSYIRAPELINKVKGKFAWANFSLNSRRSGNVYAIDGKETWLIHNYLRDNEPDFDSVDRDLSIRHILGVGAEFNYDIISREDWFGRRLMADKFRQGRVFICGDSAHIWVPYAGYGMNAGIADAEELAWLLSATINGWGGPLFLDTYAAERQPITEQVSYFAMNHAHAMARERRQVPLEIEDQTAEGEAARRRFGQIIYDLNVQQYCCGGLNFGYYYDKSPIIAYDGESPPPYSMADFQVSTVPGCRTPHIWLDDGRSLYDCMDNGYTLLRFERSIDVEPIVEAARTRRLPLQVLDVESRAAHETYDRPLVLSRPDRHIAWRGQLSPSDPAQLIDLISGHAPARHASHAPADVMVQV